MMRDLLEMKLAKLAFQFSTCAVVLMVFNIPSYAFDLSGAWTTDKSVCPQVFSKTATSIGFRPNSDLVGRGFIVEGNNIRGQSLSCTIKSRSEKESKIHMIASCATDIMVDQVQMSFQVTGDNSIKRIFNDVDGLEISFVRCSFD
jgi:hypothetical protein